MSTFPSISHSNTFLQAQRQRLVNNQTMAKQLELGGQSLWSLVTNSAYDKLTKPDISVIISSCNYARFIVQALDSVCQSKLNGLANGVEIIVVDDASQDNSVQKVEDYLIHSNFPIALVKKRLSTGTAEIRNLGLQLARAAYVFVLEADNYIYPNCLARLHKALINSNCAATYSIINKFDDQTGEGCGLLSQYNWDERQLLRYPYIDAMALFNREILLGCGGYPTDLIQHGWVGWEDYYVWLQLVRGKHGVKFVPEILSVYRVYSINPAEEMIYDLDGLITYFENQFIDLLRLHNDLDLRFGIPVSYEGHIDGLYGEIIEGWAYNKGHNTIPARIDFFCENRLVGSTLAQNYRQDLYEQRIGTGYHGFMFRLPPSFKDGKPYQLYGYFAGSLNQLAGSPLKILYDM